MEARTVLGVLGGRVGRSEGDAEVPELGVPEALRRRLGAELDAEQRWAALVDHPALVMLAAAGAGKTRTLTARVEALVASGVRPSAVVVTTFTRKAAEELGERLEARGVSGVLAGTFHGLCLRWLRASGHVLAADGVLLGDEVRSRAVLEGVLREGGLSG
ncbi:MAG: ATP-dependent helicase, partial [Deltaproteobacteria bacterium]